ncbi:hypothetical protein WFA24289_01423 [Periweissella fabaria]|uniref:Uncharacterized protein n=1 Tax=Periweissella fabaria TaxID=546157 RepID=A0ABM8Z7A8_9LACO|nr:hypothetical protein WFA24289_01423 [Periweissella fabaria]
MASRFYLDTDLIIIAKLILLSHHIKHALDVSDQAML